MRGVVDEILYKKEFLTWMREEWMSTKPFGAHIKQKLREVTNSFEMIRASCGCPSAVGVEAPEVSLSWQVGWPNSAVKTVEFLLDRRLQG